MFQYDTLQKNSREGIEAMMQSFGAATKNVQILATEMGDYSKRSFEQGSAAVEQLAGVRTLDKVLEIQSAYLRSSYEGLVAQATKMGELYSGGAREVAKPFEGLVPGHRS